MFEIPTLDEILTLVGAATRPRRVGVYPETKHPSYFAALGLPMEQALLTHARAVRLSRARGLVFIQSFETANLRALRRLTDVPLVQLVEDGGQPFDLDSERRSAQLRRSDDASRSAMRSRVMPTRSASTSIWCCRAPMAGRLGQPTPLIEDAHAAGMRVHVWTLRAENHFLPTALRRAAATPRPATWRQRSRRSSPPASMGSSPIIRTWVCGLAIGSCGLSRARLRRKDGEKDKTRQEIIPSPQILFRCCRCSPCLRVSVVK